MTAALSSIQYSANDVDRWMHLGACIIVLLYLLGKEGLGFISVLSGR